MKTIWPTGTTTAGRPSSANASTIDVPKAMPMTNPNPVPNKAIRTDSHRTAERYLGENPPALKDTEGFVDTGDVLELHDGRYHFRGRHDGVINVGGFKVHPEEV